MSQLLKQISNNSDNEAHHSCCTPMPVSSCCSGPTEGSLSNNEKATLKKEFWLKVKLTLSLLFTTPLLLHMLLSYPLLHDPLFQFILSLPVFIIGLQHFGPSAYRSLRRGSANMDVLIILGISAAFLYSLIGFYYHLGPDYLFFETAAAIVCFVLVGNALEKRAVQKTTSALRDMMALQPPRAKRFDPDQQEIHEVDISEIQLKDLILTGNGEKIAFDGTVQEGSAAVDESFLTGESTPVPKTLGDHVLAGSVVIGGNLKSIVQSLEKDSLLSQMIALVQNAQQRKPQIQRIGDLVSAYFVPTVMTIAFLTFVLSFFFLGVPLAESLLRSVAVLVVACPCAMGLATPTAIMVGVGKAAKNGIVIKGGDTLERLASVDTIFFDKTGTLTEVGDIDIQVLHESLAVQEAKNIIYSLEKYSTHPLAIALTSYLHDAELQTMKDISEEKGKGIKGTNASGELYELRSSETTDVDINLLRNGTVVAAITFQEKLHNGVPQLISSLKERGMKIKLVSGDKAHRVKKIAQLAGIEDVASQKNPEEKLALVEQAQQKHQVAFVGDGINDAPVLAKAHVGISLSNATDIAVQSADIILLGGKVDRLLQAISLSERTLRTIKQNLFWAFFYNIIALPIAAAGYLSPMIAALAMAFSDVIVIGNSLRIHFGDE